MAYGVTSALAHLDAVGGGAPLPGEINWAGISDFNGGVAPSFAGRYFLGTPSQQEADVGIGLCLWAHGEGNNPAAPANIVPLQRSDPVRQEAAGALGTQFGAEDADAIAAYLELCTGVGDLVLPPGRFYVLVFLEVASGTQLSVDYWAMWAHTLYGKPLDLGPRGLAQCLEPAIACSFVQDDPASPFLPEQAVIASLGTPAPAGRHNLCYGFWCRTVLANPVFGSFVQDLHEGPVPVRYRRTFDGPGGSPIPANAPATAVPTLPLVTIDEAVPGVDDPTAYTFGVHPWNPVAPPPPDTATPPPNLPTQFGVDMQYQRGGAGPATRRRASLCIGQKEVNIRALPTAIDQPGFHLDLGTQFPGANMLHGPASFAARYVRPHINHLDKVEAANLFAAGLAVCSIWQTGRVFVRGTADGTDAFTEAEAIGQPPHTPVYFAVDISVDDPLDPNTVPLQQIVDYFSDVRRGYRLYLAGGGTTPYYVGAYAAANVLDAVYRAGLATHFWQPWPPTWGPPVPRPANWDNIAPGWRAWPHLNLWQVLLVNGQQAANNDNQALMACVPGGAQGGLDCNVAWGDPGSWFPRDPNIWTQP